MTIIALALTGYLLGSIPFGIILTRLFGAGDLRQIGSGNIGATNVLRTGNKKLAIATLLLDGLKGAAAVLTVMFLLATTEQCTADSCVCIAPCDTSCSQPPVCTSVYNQSEQQLLILVTALAALLGHIFPVWLKFKGGKGVATGLGILLALSWPTGLAAAATWLVTAFLSRISSLSALVAIALSPVYAYLFTSDAKLPALCAVMSAIIIAKHHTNIKRLLKGEEPRIGKKKTE